MNRDDASWVVWTREHRVAYEVVPLIEALDGGGNVRSGFTLTLYAAAPEHLMTGEGKAAVDSLHEELVGLAAAAIREFEGQTEVERDPAHEAVCRPENQLRPEVEVSWRIVHAGEAAPLTQAERDHVARVERRLTALGVKHGCW
jgi:hypothetical protein